MPDTPPPASPPALVDSHCHLDFPDFAEELPQVIARARAAGVTRMVTICTRLKSEPQVRAIAEAYDGVFYAAGTHPMSAAEEPMTSVEELVALARHPKFVGIGETGLDYHYTPDSAEVQKTSLRLHIQAFLVTKKIINRLAMVLDGFNQAIFKHMAKIIAENSIKGCNITN